MAQGLSAFGRPLIRAVGRKALSVIIVLWGVATLTFFAQQLIPGSPAVAAAGGAQAYPSEETLRAISERYGFDRPIWEQYFAYLSRLATGDLGESYRLKQPVADVIGEQLPATFVLTFVALAVAWLLAVASVLLTAARGRATGAVASTVELVAASLPHFWLGAILLVVFSYQLQWLPAVGGEGVAGLVLPALTLAIPLAGYLAQLTRDEFERAGEQPFAFSARARGAGWVRLRALHLLRHALVPPLMLSGWALGALFGGAVVVESLFSRQGIGRILLTSIQGQDLPVCVGVVLVIAVVYVIATILTDLIHRVVDPRIAVRVGSGS